MADILTTKRKRVLVTPIPAPKGNPPVVLITPSATGTVAVGNTVSVTSGTWRNSPITYYYQWQRNGVDIPGAVYPTYTCVNADLGNNLVCLVTAWNNDGPGYAFSNVVASIAASVGGIGWNLTPLQQWYEFNGVTVDLFPGEGIYCVGASYLSTTGNITNNSNVITNLASTTNVAVGSGISGTGIPLGAQVISIDSATQVKINFLCTATTTGLAIAFNFDQVQVPDAYCDSNGYPSSYPPGITAFKTTMQCAHQTEQYRFSYTWTGTPGTLSWNSDVTGVGTQGASSQLIDGLVTLSASKAVNGAIRNVLNWTLGTGGYLRGFSLRPVNDPNPGGLVHPTFKAKYQAVTNPGDPLRFMHAMNNGVEGNSTPNPAVVDPSNNFSYPNLYFPQDGDLKLYNPILTAANRNKSTAAQWWGKREGMPIETILQVCTELNASPWISIPWNIDGTSNTGVWTSANSTYLNHATNGVCKKVTDFLVANTALKAYIENSNEVWNGSYLVARQALTEGQQLSLNADVNIGRALRHAQKSAQVAKCFNDAATTAGVSSRMINVLAWQNANSAVVQSMLDFVVSGSAVKTYVQALSSAPYANPTTVSTGAVATTFTGAISTVVTATYAAIDEVFGYMSNYLTLANTNSLGYHSYEGGIEISFTNQAYEQSVAHSSLMHDPQAYFLNEYRRLAPNSKIAYHAFIHGEVQQGGVWYNWGALESLSDSTDSTRPRYLATAEAKLGQFTLFDPTITTNSVTATSGIGTTAASINKGLLPEATLSLTEVSGEFVISGTNILTADGARTAGTYPFSITQTYASALNGPTKVTNGNITVTSGLQRTAISSSMTSGTGALTLPIPAGAQAGDLGIMVLEVANELTNGDPVGWTFVDARGFGTGGAVGSSALILYKRTLTSGDIGTGSFTVPDSGDHTNAMMMAFRNWSGAPVETFNGVSGTATTAVSIATAANAGTVLSKDFALAIIATGRNSSTPSSNASAAWTNITGSNSFIFNDSNGTNGNGGGIIVNQLSPTADQTGNVTYSQTITSSEWNGLIFVIKGA